MNKILLSPDSAQGSSGNQAASSDPTQTSDDAMQLFEEPGGESGGGAGGADGQDGNEGQGIVIDGQGTDGDTGGDGQQGTPAAGSAQLTADDIAAAFVKATQQMGGGRQQQQQQAPATMSEADFEKTFNIFNPTDELLAGLSHEDPAARKAAYKQMGQLITRSAVTIAAHFLNQYKEEVNARFSPALQMAQRQEHDALKKSFFSANKDLVGHDTLVDMAADRLRSSGFQGTKEEAFKQVATMVRQVLKNLPQGAGAQGGGQQQQQNRQSATRMSTVSGGRSGAGGTNGKPGVGKVNLAQSLFGPRK